MKKILKSLLLIILSFFFIQNVKAANATIAVSSSVNQVIVGKNVTIYVTISSASPLGSWEYTLNYDSAVFRLTTSDVALHYASYAGNGSTKSVTYKYTFTALKSGSSRFYIDSSAVVGWDESIFGVTDGTKTVSAITYAEYQASLSANNNLKSLEIDGYEIAPDFNKDTLEYNVQVNEDETKVNIKAIPEDNTATINGTGEVEISAGNNVINITVIAQNGSEKTYKLNIEVVDKDPINVKIDNKDFVVVKIASNLTKPESYIEKTIIINEYEIPAFYSEVTEFTLVGLKDRDGNISLYIYEDGKYTKYIELNFGNITLYPLPMEQKLDKYIKTTIKIQNEDIECLTLNNDSRFKILYGLNVETKEKGLYLYDLKDNTLIKYDNEYIELLIQKNNIMTYVSIGFGIITFISLIVIINISKKQKNNKIKKEEKKKLKDNKKSKDNEIIEKESQQEEVYDIFADDKNKKTKTIK